MTVKMEEASAVTAAAIEQTEILDNEESIAEQNGFEDSVSISSNELQNGKGDEEREIDQAKQALLNVRILFIYLIQIQLYPNSYFKDSLRDLALIADFSIFTISKFPSSFA